MDKYSSVWTLFFKTENRAFLFKILLLTGVILAIVLLASHFEFAQLPQNLDLRLILLLSLIHLLYLLSNALSWQRTVKIVAGKHIPITESLSQIIFVLIGKYIPGKIWGLGARILRLNMHGVTAKQAALSTYLEQLLLTHTGAILGLFSIYAISLSITKSIIFTLILISSLSFFPMCHNHITRMLIPYINKKLSSKFQLHLELIEKPSDYFSLSLFYMLNWLTYGSTLLVTYLLISDQTLSITLSITLLGVNAIAMLIGFFAFFIPGGIGVREGVAISILSQFIDLPEAVTLVLCHRLWLILADTLCGLFIMMKQRNIQPPLSN